MWELLLEFDEPRYLVRNPDVASAVTNGSFVSGLQHYLLHGWKEKRLGTPDGLATAIATWLTNADRHPWPPPDLRERVHGDADLENFRWLGHRITIDLLVALHGADLLHDVSGSVLDFGVGCGRVARYWASLASGPFAGSDIDPETIAWSHTNLGDFGRFPVIFRTNPQWPPLALPSASMQLIYAISVFTHLPLAMEQAWIEELARVAAPGAIVALTTHSPDLYDDSGAAEHEPGFVYSQAGGADGLPEFYRTSFHSEAHIRSTWSRWFTIVDVLPKAINEHQDLVICRRPL